MKTKINNKNYITKGLILLAISGSLMITTLAQKSQAQDFAGNEKNANVQYVSGEFTGDNSKNISGNTPAKKSNKDMSLEAFLAKAAGINANIAAFDLDNNVNEAIEMEQFLIDAAKLNQIETIASEENNSNSDSELENFLLNAAQLDSPACIDINASSELENSNEEDINFFETAAGMYTSNALISE